MTLEWSLTVGLGTLALGAILYGMHMLDERKWARDAERRAEWERTHPAE